VRFDLVAARLELNTAHRAFQRHPSPSTVQHLCNAIRAYRELNGGIMSSDPTVVADEVREQVTEVAQICNRILATTGPFVHPYAIRNDLMSAIIALELAELQLVRMLFP
jgi:hypothetical protein